MTEMVVIAGDIIAGAIARVGLLMCVHAARELN
jgi:hypothetical protein